MVDPCAVRHPRADPAKARLFCLQPLYAQPGEARTGPPVRAMALPPPPGVPVTEMGWEIAPGAFRDLSSRSRSATAATCRCISSKTVRPSPTGGMTTAISATPTALAICVAIWARCRTNRGGRAGARLFRLVAARQFRMALRLRQRFRFVQSITKRRNAAPRTRSISTPSSPTAPRSSANSDPPPARECGEPGSAVPADRPIFS